MHIKNQYYTELHTKLYNIIHIKNQYIIFNMLLL